MNKKVLKKKIPVGFKSAIVYLFATVFTRGLAIITTPIFTRIMSTDQVKKTKMIMISSAIAALLNIVLNYLMINAYGYMAAAYTTLVSYIVMAALLSIWANREFKKNVTAVDFVYDNKMIAIISVLTLIISMLAILIYDYAFVRYAIAALIFTVTVLYGVRYLKANKDMKNKKA